MGLEYVKRATKQPETESGAAQRVAAEMLAAIESRGEEAVREYAATLDGWTGDIVVPRDAIERRTRDIPERVRRDIEYATERVFFSTISARVWSIARGLTSATGVASFAGSAPKSLLIRSRNSGE